MYTNETHRFETEQEMLDYLKDFEPVGDNKKIAIVGGHYMLMYDKYNDELIPMIHQDINDPEQKEFAKLWAGDFPVKTFEYAVELYKNFTNLYYDSKIVLLINDHKFLANNFQSESIELVKTKGEVLRKHFFKNKDIFPKSYLEILKSIGNKEEIIFDNANIKRPNSSILPKIPYCFSEQSLMHKFEHKTRYEILKNKYFYRNNVNKENNIYFNSSIYRRLICLTLEGKCGCSAEITQFIIELSKQEFYNIIIFSPDECHDAVNNGVEAAFGYLDNNFFLLNVFVVTYIPSYKIILHNNIGNRDIIINLYSYLK